MHKYQNSSRSTSIIQAITNGDPVQNPMSYYYIHPGEILSAALVSSLMNRRNYYSRAKLMN